ncbi:MAG: RNase adapter RapZ [Acidobacteriota bacterium]|nr:RNase adapter RapZ [Acidobacteriota bacterium]
MSLQELVIITGMSGSGKGTALKTFEDLRFFCVDNLPVALIPKFVQEVQASGEECRQAALVIDVRAGDKLRDLELVLEKLRKSAFRLFVLFLEAGDEVLLRRFSETRRPHPLDTGLPVRESIRLERERLGRLRDIADLTVDTSDCTVHQVKALIEKRFLRSVRAAALKVVLMSFGFKHGVPPEADMILDVRFLANPYFEAGLKELSGRDRKVKNFLRKSPDTGEFVRRAEDFLQYLLPNFMKERKSQVTVAIGCTGGRHRSVFVVEELAGRLKGKGRTMQVVHRDAGL